MCGVVLTLIWLTNTATTVTSLYNWQTFDTCEGMVCVDLVDSDGVPCVVWDLYTRRIKMNMKCCGRSSHTLVSPMAYLHKTPMSPRLGMGEMATYYNCILVWRFHTTVGVGQGPGLGSLPIPFGGTLYGNLNVSYSRSQFHSHLWENVSVKLVPVPVPCSPCLCPTQVRFN